MDRLVKERIAVKLHLENIVTWGMEDAAIAGLWHNKQ
jgi:hypothetical protein